jgi:hypothetical protein
MAITSARTTYAYDNKLAGMAAPTFAKQRSPATCPAYSANPLDFNL